jgi:uncharacterized protein CbrC (UPF0167 family)
MGPIFTALEEIEEAQDAGELVICPWCIADGRAAAAYDARFVELAVIHRRPGVAAEVVEEVERRTPGFRPLFGPYWVRHHGDACAFVITVTSENLPQLSPEEQEAIRDERQALEGDHPAPVYLFRCLHCGRYLTHE